MTKEVKSKEFNHIKLSYFHIGFAVFYSLVFGTISYFVWRSGTMDSGLGILNIGLFFVALHAALAWGARKKSPIARKGSIVVGVLLFFGFPVGTILSLFFLPLTDWDTSK